MLRAGVFIGVARSGERPPLPDACAAARDMHEWAVEQGLLARLITDDERPVDPGLIAVELDALLAGPPPDQLVVYFAGHGVNVHHNEHWLLTDGAVNLAGTVELARYRGIRHTVFISDAYRARAAGPMRGDTVLSDGGAGDRVRPVDQFFASALGRPADEPSDPARAAAGYKAVYTGALLDALRGRVPDILDRSGDPLDPVRYVRPAHLQDHLEREVPARLRLLGLADGPGWRPEALLVTHSGWLSRIVPPPFAPAAPAPLPAVRPPGPPRDRFGVGLLERFGPDHFETGCGIKVRGTTIRECAGPGLVCEPLGDRLVRVNPGARRAGTVALRFGTAGGTCGTVVPVFAGFLTELTLLDGELVDVGFEPSVNGGGRWRADRVAAAAAMRHGRLTLPEGWISSLLARLSEDPGADPALLLHTAYALHDRQDATAALARLSGLLQERFGVNLFDVALLDRRVGTGAAVVPSTPLLARGWALHPARPDLEATLLDSPWSLYDGAGFERLRDELA